MIENKYNRKHTIQNNDLMRCIDIQALIEWERDRVIIQRRVGRRVVYSDRGMCKSRDKLLYVANTLRAGNGRAKCGTIPELEVKAVAHNLAQICFTDN